MLFTKNPSKYSFQTFECCNESSPISSCHFWNDKVRVCSNFASLFAAWNPVPFWRGVLLHVLLATPVQKHLEVINCKLKSNFWLYIFTASLPVFDHQDMCLLSCYYNTDGCHWLLNRCFVNECFDSEIHPIYKHFKVICAYRAPN